MIVHDHRCNRAGAAPHDSTLLSLVVIGVAFLTVAMAFGARGDFRKFAQGLVDPGCLSLVS